MRSNLREKDVFWLLVLEATVPRGSTVGRVSYVRWLHFGGSGNREPEEEVGLGYNQSQNNVKSKQCTENACCRHGIMQYVSDFLHSA